MYSEEERRRKVARINDAAEVTPEKELREELEQKYGPLNVWNSKEVSEEFVIEGFLAPYCTVIRRSDSAEGTLEFCHSPRFYYNFIPLENFDKVNDMTKMTITTFGD